MTNLAGAIQELNPGAVIELFELDLSQWNAPNIYFHAGTNRLDLDVVWQGRSYIRYPIQATGFEWKGQGTLPRPHLAVANLTGIISAMCRMYRDMVGAPVIRRRTLVRYLDAVNFPDGNPSADPNESFPDDIFFINQKIAEGPQLIDFELAVAFDVEGVMLPRRQVIRNACPWRYRGDGCGYAGPPVADRNDNPTSDPAVDDCGKRMRSCKMRFPVGWVPFGGFPAAGRYR
jgi:lambda family phage minor tail protein L